MEKSEISDVNMYALSISTILGFLSVHSSIIEKPLFKWFNRPTSVEMELRQRRVVLKTEQLSLSMVDEFAKYSKLQRRINAIDEELKHIQENKTTNSFIVQIAFTYGVRLFFGLLLFAYSIYYRHTPVLYVGKKFSLFPFTNFVCYPNDSNYVSFYFWGMCSIAVAHLIS